MPSSLHRFSLVLAACAACSNTETVGFSRDATLGDSAAATGKDGPFVQWGDVASHDLAPSPFCKAITEACTSNSECCSGICDPASATCATSINQCTAGGGACLIPTECCSMSCTAGRCNTSQCVADGQACIDSAACCSGNCISGLCQPLNTACSTAGNPCSGNAQCCSQLCEAGVCKLGSSFCIQTGDACSDSNSCCSGDCYKVTGSQLGLCAAPPSGATYCSDGIDGTVCGDCNNCCSRLCAPYGPTGVKVCQPASGCRVNGDLCRKDSDCCGAPGTGLPGEGNVTCEIDPGKALGICRNPRSCNPQGNVCHYKNYTCSVSSARNDCCAAVGNSGVCQLDFMGVPRCNGLGTTCIPGGGICSSAMDCCNQMPCIPDGTGLLRCYLPPSTIDGGVPSTCVPSGGPCTVNADCCAGVVCIAPQGSTQGICGLPPTTPPGRPGQDAGATDAAAPVCAEYGQQCTTSADCCSAIPCTRGRCITDFNIP
jgi:hypothetical protein